MNFTVKKITKNRTLKMRYERGIVLMIALIVLVAMSLAGVALVRSVDTTTQIAGNLAFRQGVTQEADRGIEEANKILKNKIKASNVADDPTSNYFASQQATTIKSGVPDILMDKTKYPSGFNILPVKATNNQIRYVIERLCDSPGLATETGCVLATLPNPDTGDDRDDKKIIAPPIPLYRVTVRVDGPKNTVSIIQAMMR